MVTFGGFPACRFTQNGDICKCSKKIGGPASPIRIAAPEVLDGRSTRFHAGRRDRSPARRTSSLRSAFGRIASKALPLRRRTTRGSALEEAQAARQGPDLRAGTPQSRPWRRSCRYQAFAARLPSATAWAASSVSHAVSCVTPDVSGLMLRNHRIIVGNDGS